MAKKILFLDDTATIRQIITFALQKNGYEVVSGVDGVEGVEGVAKAKEQQFDMIITDLNMPNMNGFEMVEEVKKLANYQRIPILMLTTETSKEFLIRGKNLGITAWCAKPIKPDELVNTIEMAFKKFG